MFKMVFPKAFVDLIVGCTSTISYSILVNGECFGLIIPERDLRQRDPFSSYLFLLCSEGLAGLLKRAVREKLIHDISTSRRGP